MPRPELRVSDLVVIGLVSLVFLKRRHDIVQAVIPGASLEYPVSGSFAPEMPDFAVHHDGLHICRIILLTRRNEGLHQLRKKLILRLVAGS